MIAPVTKFITLALLFSASASAEIAIDSAVAEKCGSLEVFVGAVQIFDASRTQVIDTQPGQKLRCGDWVSVESGKATLKHKSGYQVQVLEDTFIQFGKAEMTLFRGTAEVIAPAGIEARLSTANARASFKGSHGILVFNSSKYETQLIGIEGRSVLENRYLSKSGSPVTAGTFSRVEMNDNRLQATRSRAVELKPFAEMLGRFGVGAKVRDSALTAAKAAAATPMPKKLATTKKASRSIASTAPAAQKPGEDSKDDPQAFKPVEGSDLPGQVGATFSASEGGRVPATAKARQPKPVRRPARAKSAPLNDVPLRSDQQASERKKLLNQLSTMGEVGEDE